MTTDLTDGKFGAERPAVLIALLEIDDAHVEEFHEWYDTEHVPMRQDAGIERIRRWERRDGTLPRFLATYEVPRQDVLTAGPYAAMKARGDTPWTTRIKRLCRRELRGIFLDAPESPASAVESDRCRLWWCESAAADWPTGARLLVDREDPGRRVAWWADGPADAVAPAGALVGEFDLLRSYPAAQ